MKLKIKKINLFSEEPKIDENVEGDYMEDAIGAAGLWQVVVATVASLTKLISVGNMTSIVFLTPITTFKCVEFQDSTTTIGNNDTCYDTCTKYAYNSNVMETTLISDFGLICENAWLQSLPQTIIMLGVVVGVYIFGWISDRFGRRTSLIASSALNIAFMTPSSFVHKFWVFNCLRFFTGVASSGAFSSVSVVIEVTGNRYRGIAGILYMLPDGIAEASLALLAYYLPKWRTFLLGLSVSSIPIFVLVCFLPESPRWLVTNGKFDKAIENLEKAAKINKRSVDNIKETVMKYVQTMKLKESESISMSYGDFFREKRLRSLTISTLCVWAIIGTAYYGIYQFVSLLSDNVFITVPVLGLIQIPLCLIGIIITKLLSRKASLGYSLLLTGCIMIVLIWTPFGHWSTDLLGIIGFSACCLGFAIIFIYEGELFPTKVRSMAFGLSCGAAKLGAVVAPFIANISPVWIPSAIFGGMSLIAVGFCIMLPETKGKNLKDISLD